MKNVFTFLIAGIISLLSSIPVNAAERGDIVSYEKVKEWNNEEVIEESFKMIEGLVSGLVTDPELKEPFYDLVKAIIRRNIERRSLSFYKLTYNTIDFNEQPATATGMVIVPQRPYSDCNYGIAVYNHGTRAGRYEVSSYQFITGGLGAEFFFPIIMAAMEHFVVVPDYYGMGDGPGIHHHNMDKTNSNSVIDMIRAGRKLATLLNNPVTQRVVISGYSEGGTVTMAIAKRIYEEKLQQEFPQLLLGPASGAYDMGGEAYRFIVDNPYYRTRYYILYQASSCQDMYKELYDPNDPNGIDSYLRPPYNELYKQNVLGQTGNSGWVPLPWTNMFNDHVIENIDNHPEHPFRTCLSRNNTYDWANPYETFLYYCNTDDQVPASGAVKTYNTQQAYIPATRFWDRFKLKKFELSFNGVIPDHETCALPSMLLFFEEMRARKKNTCRPKREFQSYEVDNNENSTLLFNLNTNNAALEVKDLKGQQVLLPEIHEGILSVAGIQPGIYLTRNKATGGKTEWDYFIKAPLEYVNTEDYNPVRKDADGSWFVDISLLAEPVKRLEIYNESGVRIRVITNAEGAKDQILLNSRFPDGKYTVMVVTDAAAYPLLWDYQAAKTDLVHAGDFTVNINSGIAYIRANGISRIRHLQLFDVQGRSIYAEQVQQSSSHSIDMNILKMASGIYFLNINNSEAIKIMK